MKKEYVSFEYAVLELLTEILNELKEIKKGTVVNNTFNVTKEFTQDGAAEEIFKTIKKYVNKK